VTVINKAFHQEFGLDCQVWVHQIPKDLPPHQVRDLDDTQKAWNVQNGWKSGHGKRQSHV